MNDPEIESSYPLTPLQQGMLYHALSAPGTGVDIEQLVITLREAVDAQRLRRAWEKTIARHAILRTAFRWETLPVQQVIRDICLPWQEEELTGANQEERFARFLQQDRASGFAMDHPPLFRLRLFCFGAADFRLVWTFHHALLDGRSFLIVLRDVFAFFDDHPIGEEPRPFREFVDWLGERQPAESERYWRDLLAGFRTPISIPIEHVGECSPDEAQGDADLLIPSDTVRRLREIAATHDLTLNTLVQGAWALLLHRYSGEDDVVFGATRACRHGTVAGAKEMVGLFINTLPIRVRVLGDAELIPWLIDLRAQWVRMRAHEHTPLTMVRAWSDAPHGKLLFDTIVVFENYELDTHLRASGGPWLNRRIRLYEQTNFALTLAAYAAEELQLRIEFDRSRFDPALVERLLGHLSTLLSSFAADPSRRLGEFPLMASDEEAGLVRHCTSSPPPARSDDTLHDLFHRQALRTPDCVAVRDEETQLTYAELNTRAAKLAHHLRGLGVSAEVIVALYVERSVDLIVSLLGILKAGGAYLPIDLAYPPERLQFMLADAKAPVIVTQKHLASTIAGQAACVVCVDDFNASAELHDAGAPDTLAYVIYTSGSTGQPKGCCLTHRNVVRLMRSTEPWFQFSARDVWTMFHSIAFDFSVWELWGALLYGGRLVVVSHEVSRSPDAFVALLSREQVTVLNQTPSAFRQLIAAEEAAFESESVHGSPLHLRLVIFGGEALEMQSLRPWFDRHGDRCPQLVNMYGITETTVHVTYRPLTTSDLRRGSVIGAPIPDLELFILDSALRPLPVGVPGEMFVGGAGLARGYLRRPQLTAERFIPHPWRPGHRLYRTGDLARWLPRANGGRVHDVEYLGRLDQQVKIRGFRIELGEIESVLLQHPSVREVVVIARDQRLIAYIVGQSSEVPPANELRSHLKSKLPDYMVPAAFVPIERVPLTINGKTDVSALPDPAPARPETGAHLVEPRTSAETQLAEIWRRVLHLEKIGIHDNFFDLGGDSILSILVVAQARKAGIALTPKLLFEHPTIAELAASESQTPATWEPERREGQVPLTPIQHWFLEHNFANPNHWNQAFAFRVSEPIPHEELDRAVGLIAARHGVFRARFTRSEAGWQQHLTEKALVRCETVAHPNDAAAQQGLDIAAGPMLRVVQSLQPAPRLFVVAHHLVVDGVSWRVFLQDLDDLLAGRPLGATTTPFARWAELLNDAASSPALREELPHWHELAASKLPTLPTDFPSGENIEASSQTISVALNKYQTEALLRGRAHGMLLTALEQAFDGQKLLVDVEGHGREEGLVAQLTGAHADLSHTIGWFTSIYPMQLGADKPPRNGLGYGLLRHIARIAPRPRAQILFNYLGQLDLLLPSGSRFSFENFSTEGWRSPEAQRTHVLEINCAVLAGQFHSWWTYSANIHRKETVARYSEAFRSALVQLLEPAQTLPLSPLQELYYTLESARPGSGVDQWHGVIRGEIDVARYRAAWESVLNRHEALRTTFHSEGHESRQRFHDAVQPEWIIEDWSDAFSEDRFARFLASDQDRGFDLGRAPLTRLALIRVAANEFRIVWNHHHLQIDGWSWPIVLREVADVYHGKALGPAPSYRAYVEWLASLPEGLSRSFWTAHLRDFAKATPLPCEQGAGQKASTLDYALTQRLREFGKKSRVTLNAICQAAWAIVLAARSRSTDVIFGASFSGRAADFPGIEGIVGPMVNNLPVRARFESSDSAESLIRLLHEQAFAFQEHQFSSIVRIQEFSSIPWNERLFDTLLVFQNYVTGGDLMIEDLATPIRTNYPLTLVITPGPQITFSLIGSSTPDEVLGWLRQVLITIVSAPSSAVGAIMASIPERKFSPVIPSHRGTLLGPRTALEKQIAAVWCEAFGATEVGIRDNFFDLGGHSLLMIRVHARLREILRNDISIVRMFQHPTIESLARFLSGSTNDVARSARDRAARQRILLARKS